jgi:hypothetical protein
VRVISLGAILLVLVATIGVFTFAKPQYRMPCNGCSKSVHFNEAKPPVNGWLFADPTPGFHLGEHKNLWNMSAVLPKDVPADAGIFVADRSAPGVRPEVLYWRRGCLVAQLSASRTRVCNPHAAAVFIARTAPVFHSRSGTVHDMFLIGVVRSDVTRVTVHSPGATQIVMHGSQRREEPFPPQVVYDKKTPGWWGSWEDSTFGNARTWNATVKVYGKHGLIATTKVLFENPGEALYCASALRAVCGVSAQRRS